MSSFALWFETDSNEGSDFIADIHFNLWNLHYRKAKPPFLDIGIKIYEPQKYSKVFFYIPWIISKDDITDLGQYLKSSEMLCTIFNDDYALSQEPHSKIIKANNLSDKSSIEIYCLDTNSDIVVDDKYDGTIICFDRPKSLSGTCTEYFRFRITSSNFNRIIKTYNPKNVFLQSAFSTVEAIDFRFNDYRSLPSSLLEVMRNDVSFKIGKVHFLLITESDVDLLYSSISPTARELEEKIWIEYFKELSKKHVVAYHWRVKSENKDKLIENCIMFVKTKVHTCNWITVILYIVFAGLLAILFNFISHLLF